MKLEGLLVDLVPRNQVYLDREHVWRNNESSFWSSGGERYIATQAMLRAQYERWDEARTQGRDDSVTFGLQTKAGTPIGFISINWLHTTHRLALLGAKIGEPDHWGGGYGTDALLLIVDYAFDWLDVRKIWLLTTSMNERVQRQMVKCDFKLEARQRRAALADGVWYDWLAYGLLREEWPGRDAMITRLALRAKG